MPLKNTRQPSKSRTVARASKSKKQRLKRGSESKNKIAKAETTRGARPGLLPTSGPRARLSGKKARKLEKKMGYALKRKMESEGEAEMTDAPALEADEEHGKDEMEMEGIE